MPYSPKPKRNRRPLDAAQQWRPVLVPPLFSEILSDTQIALNVSIPMFGVPVPTAFTMSGGVTVSGVAYDPDAGQIVVTTSARTPATRVLSIAAYESGLRTQTGGYLSPAEIVITDEP